MSEHAGGGRGNATPPATPVETIHDYTDLLTTPIPDLDEAYLSPDWHRRSARNNMVKWALWLFVGTIIGSYGMAPFVTETTWERIESVMNSVIPVETLIIGAAASYFFKD